MFFVPLQKIKKTTMRFYQEWKGIIWEFNSITEYFMFLVCRIIGFIIGVCILFLMFLILFLYLL